MARSVLGVVIAWAWFSLASPAHAAEAVSCSAKRPAVEKLRQHLSASPLFRAMSARYRKPRSCKAEIEGEKVSMVYLFRGGARLAGTVDASIEYSEERADSLHMEPGKATGLLREAEGYKTPGGCGIQWSEPEEEKAAGSRNVIYRGSTCNCQARLVYDGNFVASLVLRSAC